MIKVYGSSIEEKYIMCSNPSRGYYIIIFDIEETGENQFEYMQKSFEYKPELEEIKKVITDYNNSKCDNEILKGLRFEDSLVWLSTENQQNYLRDLNLAKITGGGNLPIKYKFGADEEVYKSFESIEDLEDFNIQVAEHINNTLSKYWLIKDNIDWNKYIL